MLHTFIYKGLCLKGLCVMGWIWILCPSSSLQVSSGINTAIDIKGPFLFASKSFSIPPIGIQDGCCEPSNPKVNSGEKLNVLAHALMWFYNSYWGFHDGKINYEDICSHQNGEVGGWVSFQNVSMFYVSFSRRGINCIIIRETTETGLWWPSQLHPRVLRQTAQDVSAFSALKLYCFGQVVFPKQTFLQPWGLHNDLWLGKTARGINMTLITILHTGPWPIIRVASTSKGAIKANAVSSTTVNWSVDLITRIWSVGGCNFRGWAQPRSELSEGQSDAGGRRWPWGRDLQYTPKCHLILLLPLPPLTLSAVVLSRHATVTTPQGEKEVMGGWKEEGNKRKEFFFYVAYKTQIKMNYSLSLYGTTWLTTVWRLKLREKSKKQSPRPCSQHLYGFYDSRVVLWAKS